MTRLLSLLLIFLMYCGSPVDDIERLIGAGKIGEARQLLQDSPLSRNEPRYHYYAFLLALRQEKPDLPAALTHLAKASVTELPEKTRELLREQLVEADSKLIHQALQALVGQSIGLDMKAILKQKAEQEQLIAAWDNYLLFCTGEKERTAAIRRRRQLLLDPQRFESQGIDIDSFLAYNPCYLPILRKIDRVYDRNFSYKDLFNTRFDEADYLSGRYVVADFNTVDKEGRCRGSSDLFPENHRLTEFSDLMASLKKEGIDPYDTEALADRKEEASVAEWLNYLEKVERYRTPPIDRPGVVAIGGRDYCFGQQLCLCEINADTLIMVARFITSSKNARGWHGALKDIDGQPRYYAPLCYLKSRYWDRSVSYDERDKARDERMGGGSKSVVKYRRRVDLPNFMHMIPADEYPGAKGFVNGIHEYAVGGSGPEKYMGSPVSLGCVRLYDYPSKFIRWWTPLDAKMFISYEFSRYRQRAEQ